jgi:hypothetical protein
MVECWFLDGGFSTIRKLHFFEVYFWPNQFDAWSGFIDSRQVGLCAVLQIAPMLVAWIKTL